MKSKTIEKPKRQSLLKRDDIKALLVVRNLFRQQAARAEEKRRAQTITQVDSLSYAIRKGTLESYIYDVLSSTHAALHINDIITTVEALGWKTTSVLHKYSQVYRTLLDNEYMFMKVSRGTFRLRDGFRGEIPEKPTDTVAEPIVIPNKIITLQDVVLDVASRYKSEDGINPSRVHYIMCKMGYRCAYSSVYRAMQTDRFTKNGDMYEPKNTL